MKISKEDFVKTLNFIKEQKENINKVDEALSKISTDFCSLSGMFFDYEETLIQLLEKITNDEENISWWVYDTNFGEKYTKIYDQEDRVIEDIKTAEDLYELIIKENNK